MPVIRAGAAFVGAGTSLTDKEMIKGSKWDELAAKLIAEVKAARV